MGRPTKLTKETQERFLEALKMGLPYELCAEYAGITSTTFYDWMKRGKAEPDSRYAKFSNAVKTEQGASALAVMARIREAANNGQWQAGAWILERRFPQHFGRRQQIEHAGSIDTNPDADEMAERIASRIWEEMHATE